MGGLAIQSEQLVKSYGRVRALEGLDLEVRSGEIYGFLGPNGAGKTTTIRLLVDLIRPDGGSVSVLGLDPASEGVELRRRVGYLAGDFIVDGRQTAGELLAYIAHIRGGIPAVRIDALIERLDLDPSRRIRTLSRGNRQKVGVIQAFMHEPELLILDEPTVGLDPLLQREFASMVQEAAAQGRTVFMSSHNMSEVQRLTKRVGMIHTGRLTAVAGVDELRREARRRFEVVFAETVDLGDFVHVPGVSEVVVDGRVMTCRLDGVADELIRAIARHRIVTITAEEPDIEEVFFERYESPGSDDAP
jgi:ABC-2 type transport system ATP-binding protein